MGSTPSGPMRAAGLAGVAVVAMLLLLSGPRSTAEASRVLRSSDVNAASAASPSTYEIYGGGQASALASMTGSVPHRHLLGSSLEDKIRDAFGKFGDDVKKAADTLGGAFEDGDAAEDAEEVGEDAAEVGADVAEGLRRRRHLLGSSLEDKIRDAFGKFGDDVKKAANAVGDALKSEDAAEDAEEVGEDAAEVGEDVAEGLRRRRHLLGSSLEDKIRDAFSKFGDDVKKAADTVGDALKSEDAAEDAEEVGEDAAEVGEDVAEGLRHRRHLLGSSLEDKIRDAFSKFGDDVKKAADTLGGAFEDGDAAEDAEEVGEDAAEVGADVAEGLRRRHMLEVLEDKTPESLQEYADDVRQILDDEFETELKRD